MPLRLGVELVEKLQALITIASDKMTPGRTFFERWFMCLHPCFSILRLISSNYDPAFFRRNRIIKTNPLAGQDIDWKYASHTLILQ